MEAWVSEDGVFSFGYAFSSLFSAVASMLMVWFSSEASWASGLVSCYNCPTITNPGISIYNVIFPGTVKCHYNACHCNANASLTRSILGSQTAPTSWHALMTVPEWLSTWAKGVKSSRSDRPQRQWHLFVPIQLEQNKRIPPAGHVKTVDSWLIFDQTHWLFISDALRMPPFGQYGC